MQQTPIAADKSRKPKISAALKRGRRAFAPFPPFADRAAWQQMNWGAHAGPAARLVAAADAALDQAVPQTDAHLWLAYSEAGLRQPYEKPQIRRRQMLGQLALAHGLTGDAKYLQAIEDVAWAILEESEWAWPAHCPPGLPDPDRPVLDLSAAMTGFELAELDYLMGDALRPAIRRRIRREVEHRCFKPYLERDHHWMFGGKGRKVNNWAAVCNCGTVGAAMYLIEDDKRLARMLKRALPSMQEYLGSFDADGGSTEGPAYWGYGFSYFTAFADLLAKRTDGAIDLMDGPGIAAIAAFPLRTVMSPGRWVSFSDADEELGFIAGHLDYLAAHTGVSALSAIPAPELPDQQHAMRITWMLRDLVWQGVRGQAPLSPAAHDWFADMGWMLSRVAPDAPDGLVVAAKGGHNDEMHNQNDVGSFIVHWRGESLLADPGRGRYEKGYFGPERYSFFTTRSLSHSVPVVNGQEQGAGRAFAASVIAHETGAARDRLVLDLTHAYPEAARVTSLIRTIEVHRDNPGAVTLTDRFTLAAGDEFQSVLITLKRPELQDGCIVVHGQRGTLAVIFDPDRTRAAIETEPGVNFQFGPTDVHRLVFALKSPATEGQIELRMLPQ